MNKAEEDEISFQLQRNFATLGRNILVLFEDLKQLHNNNFNKLRDNLPQEFTPVVDMSNYFDENSYAYWRKKVLDIVNSTKRDLEANIVKK